MLKSLIRLWVKIKSGITGYGFFGRFNSFEEAQEKSGGYDNQAVFEKVTAASRLARDGKVAFERDGLTFDLPEYSTGLLSCLLYVLNAKNGKMNVLDFGGALGSHYFQHRVWFAEGLTWHIVEQGDFVKTGQQEFQNGSLRFFYTIADAIAAQKPDFALLGCVLPYLPEPYKYLDEICNSGAEYLFIDKHPVIKETEDRLTVQRVSPAIYEASYPAWFFSEEKFNRFMSPYELVATYPCPDIFNIDCAYKSYFYRLKKS